jgi:asparagine synthase (glutamine-hydrolysing)
MCSISGVIGDSTALKPYYDDLIRSLHHRGPDANGRFIGNNCSLFHTRLSILDLSEAGAQPMESACKRFVLSFNGEIYNHLELRKRFISNFPFKGHSDTETILELFADAIKQKKPINDILNLCNGMWAFALWDKETEQLYLSRDRVGKKPLYIYQGSGFFAFASEIKGFKALKLPLTISQKGLAEFLAFCHTCAPNTFFNEVTELAPASVRIITKTLSVQNSFYWYNTPKEEFKGTYNEALDITGRLLKEAVNLRLISDVPFGAFLSGGIDSSLIVSYMAELLSSPVKTFSIGFDYKGSSKKNQYSELSDASLVAKLFNTEHSELVVGAKEIINTIPTIINAFDEPFADAAALPTYLVAKLAKEKVTVCHTGEGADEIFGGYRRYSAYRFSSRHPILSSTFSYMFTKAEKYLPRLRKMQKLASVLKEKDPVKRYMSFLLFPDAPFQSALVRWELLDCYNSYKSIHVSSRSEFDFIMRADQANWMHDDYLEKVDRTTMAVSLEGRAPFLDFNLIEFANSLPDDFRMKGKKSKRLLRDLALLRFPQEIWNKPKHGFTLPLDEWFRNELKDYWEERIFDSSISWEAYGIGKSLLREIQQNHNSLRYDHSHVMWQLLILSKWL